MTTSIISVFARMPRRGHVKTRLAAGIGDVRALRFHRAATRRTWATVAARPDARGVLWVDGGLWHPLFASIPPAQRRRQAPGDLGSRMREALGWGLGRSDRSLVIGTDCPLLRPSHLAAASKALATRDVVIGPAEDGGYYLLGLRRPAPALFRGVAWGTAEVLAQTLRRAGRAGLTVTLLDPLPDVDRAADLRALPASDRRALALP
ncbi:MAG: TIGR04282 family arsenosugar biosynthesis glycosyltransferase [Pseudomonadota bacterium]